MTGGSKATTSRFVSIQKAGKKLPLELNGGARISEPFIPAFQNF
jgi:hypothetical protein